MALMTTALLACCRRGDTRSMMPSASRGSAGVYLASESRMKTWPHSVHSLMAASSFWRTEAVIFMTSRPDVSEISERAATATNKAKVIYTERKVQSKISMLN